MALTWMITHAKKQIREGNIEKLTEKVHYYSDSINAITSIKKQKMSGIPFINRRTQNDKDNIGNVVCSFINGDQNPADFTTRKTKISTLVTSQKW
jgi:hypothetical protein